MTRRNDPRVVIAPGLHRRDRLHGAWWPHSLDITVELPVMLARAQSRLRVIHGISLDRDEWPGAPLVLQRLPGRSPTVNWYGTTEPNSAVLHCGSLNRINLLVVPPETVEDVALAAMMMTTMPGNSAGTTEALANALAAAQQRRPRSESVSSRPEL